MDDLEIRLFQHPDLDEVVALDRELNRRRGIDRDRRAYLERYCWRPEGSDRIALSFVAAREGRIVGYVLGSVYRGEFGAVEPLAILEVIGVADDARGRGVAHALFAAMAEHARRLDVTHIRTLVAWNHFELLAFFERMGMRPTGLVPLSVHVDRVPPVPPQEDDDEIV